MSNNNSIAIIVLTACVYICYYCDGVNGQRNPCPQFLQFKSDHGIMRLPAINGENIVALKLALDRQPDQFDTSEITLLDSKDEVIDKLQNGGSITYKFDYPSGISQNPEIHSIKLNGQLICDNSRSTTFRTFLTLTFNVKIAGEATTTQSPQIHFESGPILPPSNIHTLTPQKRPTVSVSDRDQDNWLNSFKFNRVCGKSDTQAVVHTVIGGEEIAPHTYPWLVAFLYKKREYFCAGSLVSDRHVITAAHCTINQTVIFMELGKHDLSKPHEDGAVVRISRRIQRHPEYEPNTARGDIAVITLTEPVTFTSHIKPVCLWPFGSDHTGVTGVVVGWGLDSSGYSTDEPMSTSLSIVSDTNCRNAHPLFESVISETTFCAGGKKTGPCRGDSGSGFIVLSNDRWYLKGIVSTSLSKNGAICDVGTFAVYSDVAKYLHWLRDEIL